MGPLSASAMQQAARSPEPELPVDSAFVALRRPLIIFAIAIVTASVLAGGTGWFRSEQENVLEAARRKHDDTLLRLQSAEKELQDIRTYQPRFNQLVAAGMIGAENRLAWIEALRQSQQGRGIPSVTWEIEPQQLIHVPVPLTLGDYQLRASRMMVHAALLHDMDLFYLLDDLRRAGLYTVQDCLVKRTTVPAVAGLTPRLTADCTLAWISLGPPPAPPAPAAASAPGAPVPGAAPP